MRGVCRGSPRYRGAPARAVRGVALDASSGLESLLASCPLGLCRVSEFVFLRARKHLPSESELCDVPEERPRAWG